VTMRMVRAEVLKLARRRGVVIASILLTVGACVLIMVIPELFHLRAESTSSPAGGYRGLYRGSAVLVVIGSVACFIVGSAAGTGDVSSGIFRDLVATGRSRWALFGARVPGALAFFVPIFTVAFLVMSGLDLWFSAAATSGLSCGPGGFCPDALLQQAPTFSVFVHWYLWALLASCFDLIVALGLSSLLGSRSITLGILLPFELFVAPLLSQVDAIAGVRQIFFTQSLGATMPPQLGGGGGSAHLFGNQVTTSLGMAWLVIALWLVVLTAAGAWRTASRDA
jgi:hypothetical protein